MGFKAMIEVSRRQKVRNMLRRYFRTAIWRSGLSRLVIVCNSDYISQVIQGASGTESDRSLAEIALLAM